MTFWTLIRRSLRFHARSHLGVALGAATGSAALIGALIVGDSVRETLRMRALQRLANAYFALAPADRFFSPQLKYSGPGLSEEPQGRFLVRLPSPPFGASSTDSHYSHKTLPPYDPTAMLLMLPATAASASTSVRANHVQVFGVEGDFWTFAGLAGFPRPDTNSVVINNALAAAIGAREGDEVMFRVQRPGSMSRESAVMQREDQSIGLRLKVAGVLPSGSGADLDLKAAGAPAMNAFVDLRTLSARTGLMGRANVWLSGPIGFSANLQPKGIEKLVQYFGSLWRRLVARRVSFGAPFPLASTPEALAFLEQELQRDWTLADADFKLNIAPAPGGMELRSPRVFLEPAVVAASAQLGGTNSISILTYLANLISVGSNATPYSMITAAGPPYTPAGMRDDEIVLSDWLAEDLGAKPGDLLHLSYFLPDSGANLAEATNRFHVHSVVPLSGIYADRTLMPDFPGIEKAESTRDWDAAFPLVYKIRPKDEQYWKERKGTPKAFITLAAGQKMWANRFGNLTAIRFDPAPGTPRVQAKYWDWFKIKLLAILKPEEIGLRFEPVREQALKAAEQSQDFGQLFLGFSIFLVVAALLLMALLFQFGLEQRATEVGTLLALGFTPKQVRRLLLVEGVVLAFLGGTIGAFGGIGYAKAMLWALTTVWRNAVGTSALHFHATPGSLVIGFCASTIIAVISIWLTLRKQARRPARELLGGEVQSPLSRVHSRGGRIAAAACLAVVGIIGWAVAKGETSNAEVFFSAGALLLVAGLALAAAWLSSLQRKASSGQFTLADLGVRGCARRRKRSLATVALLASGSFVILSIGVFRLDANQNASKRSSGTGGFALIGEATMPVVQDLNSQSGREAFGLSANDLTGVGIVQLRVRDGDEASCLNLNRAQKPRLLGVRPDALAGRFTFAKLLKGSPNAPWELLRSSRGDEALNKNSAFDQSLLTSAATETDEIPAIGDANSIQWALGKKVGDTLDYTDGHGRAFKLRLVGAVANSILQGSLIIDEAEFVKRFPSESGYRMFLIDAPSNSVAQVSATLSRALQDTGLELTPAVRRLNAFNAVQNTYLGTFQVLGGLGLLLGSAGLGVVVLRNVLERRGELGVLTAIGFRRRSLQKLVLSEHGALLGLGLGIGIAAAAVAVLPALLSPGTQLPYASLALTLGAVLLNGLLWTWLATRFALRGNLLAALRNE